jgi:hypothetical protein
MQQLLTTKLGKPLETVVREMRNDDRTWVWIAKTISCRAGVAVSDESLRRWYGEPAQVGARP